MVVSNTHVWRAALSRLQREVTGAQLNTWLRGAQLMSVSGGAATVQVRSTFEREMIESRYHDLIERALSEVIGAPVRLTIATAAGGATRGTARGRAEAASAQYARPLFLLDDEVEPSESAPAAASQKAAAPTRVAPEPTLPAMHRIPDSPTVNASAGGAPGGAKSYGAWRERRSDVTSSADKTPYGESVVSPHANATPLDVPLRRQPDTADGKRGLHRGRDSARRNVAGEMTSMNDDTAGRFDESPDDEPSERESQRPLSFGQQRSAFEGGVAPLTPPRLNQRYTFSTFIVGSGNQLAHAASRAVADAPGYAYNPLFLYGGVGLGKTHLLHAIGHTALDRQLTVLYVSSETFTNEIVNAILYRKTEEFRAKYRSVDVLLVDDIQFIAGKDSTEEEFFHTFNSLYETNRQIVICSDRHPKAIVSLEERLRSRFEWGLIADIQPPDLETRIAILRAKAEVMGAYTPDDVILYVANRVQSNIRELEGSLNRVLAFAKLQGLPMTIDTAKAAMANLSTDMRQRRVSIEDVLDAVAEHYRIQVDDLKGKARDKHVVTPRHVAMYLMRQETEASLLEIGQALGGRDHSTVLHGCDKITREVEENTALRKDVAAIRQQLLG